MNGILLTLVSIIVICAGLFLYAYINRYELKVVGLGTNAMVVQFDRWTREKKLKTLDGEVDRSWRNDGVWIKIH